MELNRVDSIMVGDRISTEVRKYMTNYFKVWKKHKGMMEDLNSGNLKKLQQTLFIATGKRIKLDRLGLQVRDFMESSIKPEWY